jgi:anion-transporting  ArsA/GET3 family ATPase
LSDKRVILVTGKGGVGKTTVAATLALRAAQQGKRVLLCETQGSARVAPLFGRQHREYREIQLGPGLFHLGIRSDLALREYLMQQVRIKAVYRMVFGNRVMGSFMDAVPGLHDLIQLGKVMDLERETKRGAPVWDQIVVDAPATGHGLTMLSAPQTMMELTLKGPFYKNAKLVRDLWRDPKRTGLVLVSLADEMPVNETLELYERLGDYRSQVELCVLNEIHPPLPASPALWARARPAVSGPAADLLDRHMDRITLQEHARERLSALPCPLRELPYLFHRDLGTQDLHALSEHLADVQ